jgi:hypothetical protein
MGAEDDAARIDLASGFEDGIDGASLVQLSGDIQSLLAKGFDLMVKVFAGRVDGYLKLPGNLGIAESVGCHDDRRSDHM